jgi:hypothetical protein
VSDAQAQALPRARGAPRRPGKERRPRGGAGVLRRAARRAVAGRGARGGAGSRVPHRLARQRLGQAGHPARLPPRRRRRRVDGPRPTRLLRQGHAAAAQARRRRGVRIVPRRLGGPRRCVSRQRRRLHAADVRQHRRLRRRQLARRLARAHRLVRADRPLGST